MAITVCQHTFPEGTTFAEIESWMEANGVLASLQWLANEVASLDETGRAALLDILRTRRIQCETNHKVLAFPIPIPASSRLPKLAPVTPFPVDGPTGRKAGAS